MLKVEQWPIERLIPYYRNPRRNDEQVDRMVSAIKEFGFRIPVVAKSDGSVVDGHLRLKAAQKLGMTEVPVALADELTDAQVKAFRLLANKSANWAEWDDELLKLELEELKGMDFDLNLTGFEDSELDAVLNVTVTTEGMTDADEVPEVQEQVVTVEGDIWLLGKHRLMCGDSTDAGSVALLMQNEKADMVFTDPPYGVSIGDKNKALNSVQPSGRCCSNIANDTLAPDALYDVLVKAFSVCKDNCKEDASYYVTAPQGGGLGMMMMMMMMKDAGLESRHTLMWLKNAPTFSMGRLDYDYKHEPIMYTWTKSHHFYGKGEFTNSVWEIPKPRKCDLHPTMKPVALVENALLNSSKEGDIILDIFGGSGTTILASEKLKRCARLMELAPHYCDVIVRRWQDFTGQKAIREADGKTFDEVQCA